MLFSIFFKLSLNFVTAKWLVLSIFAEKISELKIAKFIYSLPGTRSKLNLFWITTILSSYKANRFSKLYLVSVYPDSHFPSYREFLSRICTISKFVICTISPWQEGEIVLYQNLRPVTHVCQVTKLISALYLPICTLSTMADSRKSRQYLRSIYTHYMFLLGQGV